jgi:hypothetical protein
MTLECVVVAVAVEAAAAIVAEGVVSLVSDGEDPTTLSASSIMLDTNDAFGGTIRDGCLVFRISPAPAVEAVVVVVVELALWMVVDKCRDSPTMWSGMAVVEYPLSGHQYSAIPSVFSVVVRCCSSP